MYSWLVGIGLHLAPESLAVGHPLAHHLLLEQPDPVEQPFRSRRTPGHVDVDRNDGVDPLHDGVVVEHTARGSARAHRDTPLGLRHLLPDAADDRGQFERYPARADEHIGLSRREAHALHPKPREVELAGRRGHELDCAAGGAEWHGPQRIGPTPVDEEVQFGRDPAFLRLRLVCDPPEAGVVFLTRRLHRTPRPLRNQSHCSAPFFHT